MGRRAGAGPVSMLWSLLTSGFCYILVYFMCIYAVAYVLLYSCLSANESGTCNLTNNEFEKTKKKMSVTEDKSALHYLALQPGHSGLSFEEFLLYFLNKDIGKLDLAISETILRDAFHKRLGSFYNNHEISCVGEFRMISKVGVLLALCQAPKVSIGESVHHYSFIQKCAKLICTLQ